MRLIYVNSSKVTKLEQKMNNSESFLLLLKNLLKCTYEVLLPSQRYALSKAKLDAAGHRWLSALENYDFSIIYRPGKTNTDADVLNRYPGIDKEREIA